MSKDLDKVPLGRLTIDRREEVDALLRRILDAGRTEPPTRVSVAQFNSSI